MGMTYCLIYYYFLRAKILGELRRVNSFWIFFLFVKFQYFIGNILHHDVHQFTQPLIWWAGLSSVQEE